MENDKLDIYVAWSSDFGTDVIGFKMEDRLYDVCAVVDVMLYEANKEPYVENLRSMAFNFDREGNRIKYSLLLDNLKYIKPLSVYNEVSQKKLTNAYMLRIQPKNLKEHMEMIKKFEEAYIKDIGDDNDDGFDKNIEEVD
jgi:hypothetical protein